MLLAIGQMIFLDVTSSCKSVINTGIQRTTRKIFAELRRRHAVTAICWERANGRSWRAPFVYYPTRWRGPNGTAILFWRSFIGGYFANAFGSKTN